MTSRIAISLIVAAAPLYAAAAEPEGSSTQEQTAQANQSTEQQAERPAPSERRICRRIESTGSRTAAQRVCMTAEQWRRAEY